MILGLLPVRTLKIEKHTVKKALADAIERRGYTTLTPVQEAVTNPEIIGADLLVSAQTGSGKTVGFGLAIAPTLLQEAERFGPAALPLALIIAPTRELAMQVKRELSWLYADAGAVVASCVGGMDMRDERRSLDRGAHIVVATPGRLRDHIMRSSIDLSDLRAVVLDEADEMLDLGFREDLEFILGEAPAERQTLMFSATVPKAIATLAKSYQKNAVRVSTAAEHSQHADIEYRALLVNARDSENAIINVLRYFEAPNALVFCNTRDMVNRLTTRLSNRGFSVVALSGELSQTERTHALQAMRDGRARVCVATDVAARGIDLPNLDLVVHAELPSNHETLLHRSGRTGRAGRKGVSVLIVPPVARRKAERILNAAKLRAEWANAPSAEDVNARDDERMLADPIWQEAITEDERPAVQGLVERFSVDQMAAAFLRLCKSRHTAPEELSDADARPDPKAAFGPSVWFSISGGNAKNAEPRRLLPVLCNSGGLTKTDIGAIRIQEHESFVEIKESSVATFLKTIGSGMRIEGGDTVTRLEKPPAGTKDSRGAPAHRQPSDSTKPNQNHSNTPTDWNDAPKPKPRKPKPEARTAVKDKRPRFDPAADVHETPAVTRRKPDDVKKPYVKVAGGDTGPKPPKGKPTSKKNKLRASIAKGAAKAPKTSAPGSKHRKG
jgi:ATP-dependent RNA helicase DeaD